MADPGGGLMAAHGPPRERRLAASSKGVVRHYWLALLARVPAGLIFSLWAERLLQHCPAKAGCAHQPLAARQALFAGVHPAQSVLYTDGFDGRNLGVLILEGGWLIYR